MKRSGALDLYLKAKNIPKMDESRWNRPGDGCDLMLPDLPW